MLSKAVALTASVNATKFFSQATKDALAQLGAGLAITSSGMAAIVAACASTIAGAPICSVPLLLPSAGTAFGSAIFSALALDPPDPNFMVIAVPVIPSFTQATAANSLTPAIAEAVNNLMADEVEIIGVGLALETSINRASGAMAANNTVWEARQGQAIKGYSALIGALAADLPARLEALQSALTAAGVSETITATDVLNFETSVATGGLPPAFTAALTQLGADAVTQTLITQLLFVQDVTAVAGMYPNKLVDPALIAAANTLASSLGNPFSRFDVDLRLLPFFGVFNISGDSGFTLGSGNSGIDPVTQEVTLQVGPATFLLSPGSFRRVGSQFVALTSVNNLPLEVHLWPAGAGRFHLEALGVTPSLKGAATPLLVGLTIGNQFGETTAH